MGAMKVWDGSAWQTVAPFSERASCYVGPDAPVGTAYAGDLWWDTDDPTIAYPGAELSHTERTTNTTFTATTAATAQLAIDSGSRTYDGSAIVVEVYTPYLEALASQWTILDLWDGATDLGQVAQIGGASSRVGAATYGRRRITPTVGTHQYKLMGWVTGGAGGIFSGGVGTSGATYSPAFLRITRV